MELILIKSAGLAIVLIALADVFLTVLHTRGDAGFLSTRLNRLIWTVLRMFGREVRSFAGPVALVLTVAMWIGLVMLGFAVVSWPDLGKGIRSTLSGPMPTDFFTAFYYSGMGLTTLGLGDFMPVTHFQRLVLLIEALLGFSLVTLSLTYFLSIYNALIRRNAFAAEIHYMSARTGDAAELLVRIGTDGEFGGEARSELAAVARELLTLLQTHHAYPVVHLFTQRDVAMSPPRVALLSLDSVSLLRSVLDPERNRDLVRSGAVEVLWDGGMQLLIETGHDLLSDTDREASHPRAGEWRERYDAAASRLAAAGYAIEPDAERGAAAYARQRRRWDGHVRAFAAHMCLPWDEIEPKHCRMVETAL